MAEPRRFDPKTAKEWEQARLTPLLRQFFRDQAERLVKVWISEEGANLDPRQQTKAQLFSELATLDYKDLASFYDWPDDEEGIK